MAFSTPDLLARYRAVGDQLGALPTDAATLRALDDAALLQATTLAASNRRLADLQSALLAGEIARRSTPDLGSAGLAQRSGFRTPQEMVRVSTGSTARDAATEVRVGTLVIEAQSVGSVDERTGEIAGFAVPWLAPVAIAIAERGLSLDAAESIRNGLRDCDGIPVETLTRAAEQLCVEAETIDADRLFRRARQLRDELDQAGIAEREAARRARRSMTLYRQSDGMTRLVWLMDPETATVATDLFDRATSPRRGGPRFVDPDAAAFAAGIADDERSTEQLASDVFLELLRQGANADSSQLLGTGAPVVRLLTAADLATRTGFGYLEGQPDPVSIETIERCACTGGTTEVEFDEHGQPLDLGREQRLYSRRQRVALAARDGGCRADGCDRPPSWTEAHHIRFWHRDKGKTDIADGILLCRHHHLLFHNNGWEIVREGSTYWVIPPADVDPEQKPRLMPSKSAAWLQLQGRAAG